jgi:hypothetical protein
MAAKAASKLDALIFIDTNILLDFYRVRNSDVGLELLELIEKHKDIIITGSQVEMEYKKNRQRVVLETLNAQKQPEWSGLTPPAFLADAKPAKMIAKARESIKTQQARLKKRITSILEKPGSSDIVYKTLQKVFRNSCEYNLSREKKLRFEIRNLARKRFVLGYPPRKQGDTSIGDAINWEWILRCTVQSGKHVILVTRDTDYGISYDKRYYLNDWLRQEFAERVKNIRRKIVLTDRLAEAFKLVKIPVSQKAAAAEVQLLDEIGASHADLKPMMQTIDMGGSKG